MKTFQGTDCRLAADSIDFPRSLFSNTLGDITLNGVLEDSFISFSDETKTFYAPMCLLAAA